MSSRGSVEAGAAAVSKRARSELAMRIGAVLVLVPLTLLAVWAGAWTFGLFAALCGVLIVYEFLHMTLGRKQKLLLVVCSSSVVAAAIASVALPAGYSLAVLVAGAGAAVVVAQARRDGMLGAAGVLYAGLPVVALVILRRDEAFGLAAVLFLLFVVWATDTGAFFAGKGIGGPKLWPRISPNKTWAGLIGGVACAGLVGFATGLLLGGTSALALSALAILLALVAQGGDLLESSLKRYCSVKDSGALIPGHGGVMDRLDGVITASVLAGMLGVVRGSNLAAGHGLLVW